MSSAASDRPDAFRLPVRIYWEDTDAGGVVYHARYVGFLERARSEWMRSLGHGQRAMGREQGVVFAVRAMALDFRKPARLDDALQVSVELRQLGRASLRFYQAIHRGDELLLEAEVKIASLGADDFRPRAIPDALHAQLHGLAGPA
ncbi:MAG: tol-pal system-associated acyl-CoA thioesterase [Pseudoxanthomonas suwonensis]|nr:tol-pal system-associated acyl-CoA thioesterase [Pseudoxanthomonas suwonensis]